MAAVSAAMAIRTLPVDIASTESPNSQFPSIDLSEVPMGDASRSTYDHGPVPTEVSRTRTQTVEPGPGQLASGSARMSEAATGRCHVPADRPASCGAPSTGKNNTLAELCHAGLAGCLAVVDTT